MARQSGAVLFQKSGGRHTAKIIRRRASFTGSLDLTRLVPGCTLAALKQLTTMERLLKGFAAATLAITLALSTMGSALGVRAGGWGMMGDSGADEYRADDNRGGSYGSVTFNWIELLVRFRQVDFGEWGTRSAPRRTGYEFNWARSGATSRTLITQGQHTGLAAQVQAGLVDNVVMQIGANDFSTGGIYDEIYYGTLAGSELQSRLDAIYNDITLALKTVQDAGADNVFWNTVQDRGRGPVYAASFPDPARRQLVTDAIGQVNSRVRQFAQSRNIVCVDMDQLTGVLMSMIDANGKIHVGNEVLDFTVPGDEPHHAFLADAEHPGTVVEGILANFMLDAFNARGFAFTKFTTDELAGNAGLGVVEDHERPTVSVTSPANGATVTGTVTATATASDDIGVVGVQFRLDGVSFGPEDLSPPYTLTWNTAQTRKGTHLLSAMARDAAGSTRISSPITVTVSSSTGDKTAPQLTITAPASGATVSATVGITATASDNDRVSGVQFKVDGTNLGTEVTAPPYSRSWDSKSVGNGSHTISGVARDPAGNVTTRSVTVTVNNGDAPPTVSFTSPQSGATVSGTVSVSANATDDLGVVGVRFTVNGATVGSEDLSAPYTISWNTTGLANGQYTLGAVARDAGGKTTSTTRVVSVLNTVQTPASLPASGTSVVQGSFVSGSAASLSADDNNFLVTRSAFSGFSGVSQTELVFDGAGGSVSRLDLRVIAKSSTSSTRISLRLLNVTTGAWNEVKSATISTGESAITYNVTSSPGNYVDGSGRIRMRVYSSKFLSSHSVYLDLASINVVR
jgi:hypothetical protein